MSGSSLRQRLLAWAHWISLDNPLSPLWITQFLLTLGVTVYLVLQRGGGLELTLVGVEIGFLGLLVGWFLFKHRIYPPQALTEAREPHESLYRSVVESQADLICVALPDTTIVFVNQAYCRFFQVEPSQVLGYRWIDSPSVSDQERQRLQTAFEHNLEDRSLTHGLVKYLNDLGEERWISWINTGLYDATGRLDKIYSVGRDVTEQKRAEQELKTSETRLRNLLDAVPDLLILVNRQGDYLYFRPSSYFHSPHPPEYYLGRNMKDIRPLELVDQEMHFIDQVLQTGEIRSYEYQISQESFQAYREVRISPYGGEEVLVLIRDITERKRAENALRYSEARNKALIQAIPDLLIRLKKDGSFLEVVNTQAVQLYDPEAARQGADLHVSLPELQAQIRLRYIQDAIRTGTLQVYEHQLQIDGELRDEEVRIMASGEDEILVMIRDITERKRSERVLDEQWQFLHRVLDSMPYRCYVRDRQGKLVLINQKALRTSQVSKGKLLDQAVHVETGEPIDPAFLKQNQQVIEVQHPMVLPPQQFLMPDGSQPWLRLVKIPMEIPGRGPGILISAIDVTEEIQSQEAFRSLYQQVHQLNNTLESQVRERTVQLMQSLEFSGILRRIGDRIRSSLDEQKVLQSVVEELKQVLQLKACRVGVFQRQGVLHIKSEATDLSEQIQDRIINIDEYPERRALYKQLQEGQMIYRCLAFHELGRMTIIEFPILDEHGLMGTLLLSRDAEARFEDREIQLAEQVAAQCAIALRQSYLYEASQAQVRELELLNQLKDDFLSTISHELRTPLTNMKMSIHMLGISHQQFPLHPKQKKYLDLLEQECRRESDLINDLLSLQQLDAGRYTFTLEPLDLNEWLPQILKGFEPRMQQRDLNLQIQIPDPLPCLMLDRPSLERILTELFTNACKYSPPGGKIFLSAGYLEQALEQASDHHLQRSWLKLTLSNPAEVPQEALPSLFDRFYRVPQTDRWKQGGTGLGLALVKQLVDGLEGEIQVQSHQGWITFTITLPAEIQVDSEGDPSQDR